MFSPKKFTKHIKKQESLGHSQMKLTQTVPEEVKTLDLLMDLHKLSHTQSEENQENNENDV